ncbi:MAG: PEP-utilizing enzyme [Patescibacteria group bacterium]
MEIKKDEYKFMWGQKQSAMITEAMLSQLLFDIDYNGKVVDSGIGEDLFILIDGVFEHYMPDKSIRRLEKNGKKYFNKRFTKLLFQNINKHIKKFFEFCKWARNQNLETLSNNKLKNILTKYHQYIKQTFVYFETSTPSGTAFLVNKINDILMKKLQNSDLTKEYFISLSSPDQLDETMKERIDFLELANKNKVSEKDLKQYAYSYPALFFNTYNEIEIIDFLKNKLKQEKNNKKLVAEKRRIGKNLKEIKKKHKKIYEKIKSNDLKYYARILQKSALYRYRLKHVWSGGEYLCLNLLKEINKRINIGFNNFIKCYRFTDIYNFLDNKKRLSKKDIQDRKECILIHYSNKKLHYYYGKNGIVFKNKLLKNKKLQRQNLQEIKGTIANKGFIQGIARIVNVKDLKQFIQDSKNFKRGEILVTTMTSPVMVSIIEKAKGIITDEGGITSHAAVVSREFKIPCIVGTHDATRVFKTGDKVEVDATKGIIKKL